MMGTPQSVWPARAILGEGPCWHEDSQSLFWLDIKDCKLYRYFAETGAKRHFKLSLPVGSVAIPPANWRPPQQSCDHIFIAGTKNGFAWLLLEGRQVRVVPVSNPEQHLAGNRFNDGKMGPDGRFYAGSMDDAEQQETGALYALDRHMQVEKLDEGYKVTNGPAFSPCGRYIYHSDSAKQTIYRFSLDKNGKLQNKSIFRQFGENDGYPDGMTTDKSGNLWVAMWDGWGIQVIDPTGATAGKITFPVARVTSCTFAGADEKTLFVTTASMGSDPDEQPLAGGLFKIQI